MDLPILDEISASFVLAQPPIQIEFPDDPQAQGNETQIALPPISVKFSDTQQASLRIPKL